MYATLFAFVCILFARLRPCNERAHGDDISSNDNNFIVKFISGFSVMARIWRR